MAKRTDCIITGHPTDPCGYGHFYWAKRDGGDGKRWTDHRFAWMKEHGDIPAGMMICHRCDNPPCCNPDHLFLGSAADNYNDMVRKNRRRIVVVRGADNRSAKLNDEQVQQIRARYLTGRETWRSLADEFGVSHTVIGKIVKKVKWSHVA